MKTAIILTFLVVLLAMCVESRLHKRCDNSCYPWHSRSACRCSGCCFGVGYKGGDCHWNSKINRYRCHCDGGEYGYAYGNDYTGLTGDYIHGNLGDSGYIG